MQEQIEQWLGTNLLVFGSNIRSWKVLVTGNLARVEIVINERIANSALFTTQLNNVINNLKDSFTTITFDVVKTTMV